MKSLLGRIVTSVKSLGTSKPIVTASSGVWVDEAKSISPSSWEALKDDLKGRTMMMGREDFAGEFLTTWSAGTGATVKTMRSETAIGKALAIISGHVGVSAIDSKRAVPDARERLLHALRRCPPSTGLQVATQEMLDDFVARWDDEHTERLLTCLTRKCSFFSMADKAPDPIAVEDAEKALTPRSEASPEAQLRDEVEQELLRLDPDLGKW